VSFSRILTTTGLEGPRFTDRGKKKRSADLFFRSAAFPCPSGTSRGLGLASKHADGMSRASCLPTGQFLTPCKGTR